MGRLAIEVTDLDDEFSKLKSIAKNMNVCEMAEYIKGQIEGNGPHYHNIVDVALQAERIMKLTVLLCDKLLENGVHKNH